MKNKTNNNEKSIRFMVATRKGKSKISSVSKIKKMRAIIKNRDEKIILDVLNGSNPHSKGDLNIWFCKNLPLISPPKAKITNTIKLVKKILNLSWKIKT